MAKRTNWINCPTQSLLYLTVELSNYIWIPMTSCNLRRMRWLVSASTRLICQLTVFILNDHLLIVAKQVRNTLTNLMGWGRGVGGRGAGQHMVCSRSQCCVCLVPAFANRYVKLFPCIKPVKSRFSVVLSVAKSELLIYSTGVTASSIQSLQKTTVSVCMIFLPSMVVQRRIHFWDRTVFLKFFFFLKWVCIK